MEAPCLDWRGVVPGGTRFGDIPGGARQELKKFWPAWFLQLSERRRSVLRFFVAAIATRDSVRRLFCWTWGLTTSVQELGYLQANTMSAENIAQATVPPTTAQSNGSGIIEEKKSPAATAMPAKEESNGTSKAKAMPKLKRQETDDKDFDDYFVRSLAQARR